MNARLARTVARHALGWLVAANVVGGWLAALLLWPELSGGAGMLTYGRLMPLHMNWQLYGWCSLPLVGVLAAWILAPDDAVGARQARWAVRAWSAALALGGVSWLAGVTSGKLFLDWSGWARPLLPVAMLGLWSVLGAALWARRGRLSRGALAARGAALAVLLAVPLTLYWAAGREVYPRVNPDSGGATGASLLGSTLGIVALGGWVPWALGLKRGAGRRRARRVFWAAFGGALLVYAATDRGHASHHAVAQIAALGTLLIWVPLLWVYFRAFAWPAAAWRWLAAAFAWWTLLVASGWMVFWPGVSERFKFSHLLVAHAHLAMAGAVTSLGAALLVALGCGPGGGRPGFWVWQGASAVHVGTLVSIGILETANAGEFFIGAGWVDALFAVRLTSGVAMAGASVVWWWGTEASGNRLPAGSCLRTGGVPAMEGAR